MTSALQGQPGPREQWHPSRKTLQLWLVTQCHSSEIAGPHGTGINHCALGEKEGNVSMLLMEVIWMSDKSDPSWQRTQLVDRKTKGAKRPFTMPQK